MVVTFPLRSGGATQMMYFLKVGVIVPIAVVTVWAAIFAGSFERQAQCAAGAPPDWRCANVWFER